VTAEVVGEEAKLDPKRKDEATLAVVELAARQNAVLSQVSCAWPSRRKGKRLLFSFLTENLEHLLK